MQQIHLTFGIRSGHLVVTDAGGNIVYKVNEVDTRHFEGRQLVVVEGSADNPVLILKKAKACITHYRWRVFTGGDRSEHNRLLFKLKKPKIQGKMELDVFSADSTEKKVTFKIKGKYKTKTCTIFEGESSTVVAQMSRGCKDAENSAASEEAFGVIVMSPTMDQGYLTAFIAILCEINKKERFAKKVVGVAGRASLGALDIALNIALGVAVSDIYSNVEEEPELELEPEPEPELEPEPESEREREL